MKSSLEIAEKKVADYQELEQQLYEAQEMIAELQKSFEDYVDLHKVNEQEIEQLKSEVNFYRQERTLNEQENIKLTTALTKMKLKHLKLYENVKAMELLDTRAIIKQLISDNETLQSKIHSFEMMSFEGIKESS